MKGKKRKVILKEEKWAEMTLGLNTQRGRIRVEVTGNSSRPCIKWQERSSNPGSLCSWIEGSTAAPRKKKKERRGGIGGRIWRTEFEDYWRTEFEEENLKKRIWEKNLEKNLKKRIWRREFEVENLK